MKMKENATYVKKQITQALLKLMEITTFEEIKINYIAKLAMVSRASFYRNFADKEDVIQQYLIHLIKEWELKVKLEKREDADWIENLFGLYKNYSEVYTLLYKSNLSHLVLDNIKAVCGPKTEQDNLQAYFNSWLAYGLFGWINEWIARGMKESPESMAKLIKEANQPS